MTTLFITIQFSEIPPSTQRLVADVARRLRGVAGLNSATWMRSGTAYALWQLFEDRERAERYLAGPILGELATLPGCEDVYIQEFEVVEGLSFLSALADAEVEERDFGPHPPTPSPRIGRGGVLV
jgi:hypothetical protein